MRLLPAFAGLSLTFLAIPLFPQCARLRAEETEVQIDAIAASVDGRPITLNDLGRRLNPPRRLTLQEASLDYEARRVLDALIMESLIEAEAEQKKIKVSDDEILRYVDEVALRNDLDRAGFEAALASKGIGFDDYKQQIRADILRSKLSGHIVQSAGLVTSRDVDQYLEQHEELSASGTKVKLSQIFLSSARFSPEQIEQRISEIEARLRDGAEFADLAREYSDGPEAVEGGVLGVVSEKDLNKTLADAISTLGKGGVSSSVYGGDGARILCVEDRFADDESARAALREEVRRQLERQRAGQRVQSFFDAELFKNHSVDKKI